MNLWSYRKVIWNTFYQFCSFFILSTLKRSNPWHNLSSRAILSSPMCLLSLTYLKIQTIGCPPSWRMHPKKRVRNWSLDSAYNLNTFICIYVPIGGLCHLGPHKKKWWNWMLSECCGTIELLNLDFHIYVSAN